ncbi:major facilitator superfamily domain-containing protein [Aspergillus ambiguus]|uniref:major facilitator superfamily domain-containing protein n=1 Tax=Aspergillus ambiguus TaxID=176160 RepID=UPI003CCE1EED
MTTTRELHSSAPGTELLIDQSDSSLAQTHQHISHNGIRIIQVPQPSLTDPNDPLRWPLWKKWATFGNGLIYAFLGAVTGPMMAGGMVQLSAFFKRPLKDITYSNGATLICQGFGTLVWMPLSVKFGRRPVYLVSNFLMGIACVWLAIASETTYPVFVLARAFLGLWEAPIEAIVPSTIADIFYLHERGEKVSYYGLSVLGGNELGPLFSAYIIGALSMRWAFFIVAMAIGVSVVMMIFLMFETRYSGVRPVIVPFAPGEKEAGKGRMSSHDETNADSMPSCRDHGNQPAKQRRTYLQDLVYLNTDKDVKLWDIFKRPFILMAYPTVLWSSLVYGMGLSWNVILGATVAQLFAPPPYNFSSGSQGLTFISPLLGSLVGTYLCGSLADQIATWFTARKNGIREPEMRLPTCVIAAVLTFSGALIAGLTYEHKTHWIGPIFGFGVLSAGAQMGATLAISYSLDCHKQVGVTVVVPREEG